MPASTAPLQSLTSKLVKSRHCLHATNLQCEQGRAGADKAKATVEKNDATIAQLEEDERKLKMQYVESKLAYEKMHALKYAKQQDLKACRMAKVSVAKESETLKGQYDAKQNAEIVRRSRTRRAARVSLLSIRCEAAVRVQIRLPSRCAGRSLIFSIVAFHGG